jgi:N-methylhydantoinase B
MDMDYDFFRVQEYSLRSDSGGAGKYRGGLGFRRVYEILADGVTFATYSDRFKLAAQGLFGGEPGETAETYVVRGGERIALNSKQSFNLQRGDLLVMHTGGGAGYGLAAERPDDLLQRDVAQGIVTRPESYRPQRRKAG